jgi:hypothetical protein
MSLALVLAGMLLYSLWGIAYGAMTDGGTGLLALALPLLSGLLSGHGARSMKRGIALAALAQVLGLPFTFVLFIALTAATQQPWLFGWLLYLYLFPVTLLLGTIGAAISARRVRRAPP